MSKRDVRRIVLSDYKAKKDEEGAIYIAVSDGGDDIKVPPAVLWSEESRRLAERAQRGEPVDMAEMFEAVLGADEWARYAADGGTAMLLAEMIGEQFGATVGESAASSSS